MLISVIIPTVDRTEGLAHAIEGVASQKISFASIEILVIDNSPNARQLCVTKSLMSSMNTDVTIHYFHEPRSGLAFARNRGVAEAKGDYIVFLDDDENPVDQDWLANLVAAALKKHADASFGPVWPQLEVTPTQPVSFVRNIYLRDLGRSDGDDITNKVEKLGTGNSCFLRRSCFIEKHAVFNDEFNSTGGEDIDFLRRLRNTRKRFVWAANAAVFEFVPAARLGSAYLSERRFRQGQLRSFLQISSLPRRYEALVFWMIVGVVQTIYGFVGRYICLLVGPSENADKYKIQMWGGLGKIFWQARYRRDHYGTPKHS